VPSKGRADQQLTARFLAADGVPFRVVVEPQELDAYAAVVGEANVLALPFSNLGQGSIPARNWIIEHAIAEGHARHWQLDDNIIRVRRLYKGLRIPCDSGPALACVEDFVDRYDNVALGGLNYVMFGFAAMGLRPPPPFYLNHRVYSCTLVDNRIEQRWRGRYNEDTDLCLQVLAAGWCTVNVNVFLIEKVATMTMKGGNTDELYDGDGRLRMARELEERWPGVVTTRRRFGRPQHIVADAWNHFDTPLKRRDGVVVDERPNEYGLALEGKPKSKRLKTFVRQERRR
jgi:hypothetical protein